MGCQFYVGDRSSRYNSPTRRPASCFPQHPSVTFVFITPRFYTAVNPLKERSIVRWPSQWHAQPFLVLTGQEEDVICSNFNFIAFPAVQHWGKIKDCTKRNCAFIALLISPNGSGNDQNQASTRYCTYCCTVRHRLHDSCVTGIASTPARLYCKHDLHGGSFLWWTSGFHYSYPFALRL